MSDHRIHWQPGVEEIVAREVAKALREAADAIRDNDALRLGHNVSVICRCLRCEVAESAERVVRDRAALADPEEKP